MIKGTVIPLLKTRALCKELMLEGSKTGVRARVVDSVDMEIYPGETVGLVGESGCGKTTLARCILRLIEPSSGSVHFSGQDLALLSPGALRAKRREFQMIFQDAFASLNPAMTVQEIITEPFEVHGLGTRQERALWAGQLLDTVSLDRSLIGRRPAELSGGQQQRAGIARALALKPRLLIADEPVSALDASVQAQILNLLSDLQRRLGLAVILISHSLGAVSYLCQRVAVMYLGRIVEEAPSARFFQQPLHPYSKILLESMPTLDPEQRDRFHPVPGEIPSLAAPPLGCCFHPRCPRVLPKCRVQSPPLTKCGQAEKVACFLYT